MKAHFAFEDVAINEGNAKQLYIHIMQLLKIKIKIWNSAIDEQTLKIEQSQNCKS